MAFTQGWSPARRDAAQARLTASGRYCTVATTTVTPRPAVSLSHLRSRYLQQGQAGTCWVHAPVQLFEVTAKSLGYTPFSACRRLVAWAGKQREDGGNPADGGSPTDAMAVMTGQGVGVGHEALCPYSDDPRVLALKPAADVFSDATKTHLQAPVKVASIDQVIALIDGLNGAHPGIPTANGYMVPDTMEAGQTFVSSYRSLLGGHSQLIWGYALPGVFDQYAWLELDNWWGLIYKPLSSSLAKQVVGYEPVQANRTSSCWIRRDVYARLCNLQGGSEHVSATDISGLTGGLVVPGPGFNPLVPA